MNVKHIYIFFIFDDISIYKYYVIKFVISLALFIFKLSALEVFKIMINEQLLKYTWTKVNDKCQANLNVPLTSFSW